MIQYITSVIQYFAPGPSNVKMAQCLTLPNSIPTPGPNNIVLNRFYCMNEG